MSAYSVVRSRLLPVSSESVGVTAADRAEATAKAGDKTLGVDASTKKKKVCVRCVFHFMPFVLTLIVCLCVFAWSCWKNRPGSSRRLQLLTAL